MDLFTWVSFIILLIVCCLLVQYYSAPSVSIYVKVCSALTWVLNFGLALLVPEDLYYTLTMSGVDGETEAKPTGDPKFNELVSTYLFLYWTVYLLTWTIIPVLQEWENSGDLNSMDRLKRSLKSNCIFYLYMLVGGVVFLVIMILLDVAGDMGLITYLKCLASAFGMFLLMLLMGYGMVEIPRSHWRTGDLTAEVKYLHGRIKSSEDEQEEAREELQEVMCHLFRLKESPQGQRDEINEYIRVCLLMVPENMIIKISKRWKQMMKELKFTEYPHDVETAIELHRWLKRVLARQHRLEEQYQQYIQKALLAEDTLESSQNQEKVFKSVIVKETTPNTWLWYCKIKPILKRCLAVFLGLFSLILLISETQVFFGTKYTVLSYFLKVHNLRLIRFMTLAILSWISYLANYSLFRLKLSNIYGLYQRGSDGPSLMFATINFSRIGAALVINFFDMIKVQGVFIYVMGGSNLGLLGNWVLKGMPGVLWIIVLMHLFDGWSRLMGLVGLEDWGFAKWNGQDAVVTVLKKKRKQLEAGIVL